MKGRMGSRKGPGALNKNFLILPGIESHLLGRPSRSLVINTNYVFSAFTYTQNAEFMFMFVVVFGLILTILLLLLLLLLFRRMIKLRCQELNVFVISFRVLRCLYVSNCCKLYTHLTISNPA